MKAKELLLSEVTPSMIERFWKYVRKTERCWPWLGGTSSQGYGRFLGMNGRIILPHRFSYLLAHGEIAPETVIDHICRNPFCVNPEHLRPLTAKENVLIGAGITAQNHQKLFCKRGHPLSGENLRTKGNRKARICRECDNADAREYQRRKRALKRAETLN
jgi:HNH endonuclease